MNWQTVRRTTRFVSTLAQESAKRNGYSKQVSCSLRQGMAARSHRNWSGVSPPLCPEVRKKAKDHLGLQPGARQ